MLAQPLVFAVTLNWNRVEDTLECLRSLLQQDYQPLRLLVVDNASSDGSPLRLAEQFPQVEQLHNSANLGFAAGFNRGLQYALQSGAERIFILNNDTTLNPNCLSGLLEAAGPDTGIAAPLIFFANPPDRIWSAGGKINPWTLEQSNDWAGTTGPSQWPAVIEQDFVTGCAMLFSRQALEQVGSFDEGFSMYYEDFDLCRRMKQAGYRILLVPQARMWHKVSASSGGKDSANERYWMARSSTRFFLKHGRGWQRPVIGFWRAGSAIRTTLRLARLGKYQSVQAYWRGIKDGLTEAVW